MTSGARDANRWRTVPDRGRRYLTFAVHVNDTHGININNVGVILMVVGAVGLVAEGIFLSVRRRHDVIHETTAGATRTTYVDTNDIDGRY